MAFMRIDMHRNHVEAQVARSRRRRNTANDALDEAVLRELRTQTEWRRRAYNMVTGPFGVEAWDIARSVKADSLRVAASLKRLRRLGYADYCPFGKTWHAPRERYSAQIIPLHTWRQ